MDLEKVKYELNDSIASIEMDYLKNFNAIDDKMADEILYCLDKAKEDDVNVLVIKGQDKAFSAGGDIGFFYDKIKNDDIGDFNTVKKVFEISDKIRQLKKPVIASTSGAVAGAGVNLAIACDFVVASENSKFIQAFVNLGLIPDTGGIYLLTKAVGWKKCSELIMTGKSLSAQEAKDLGLVNYVVAKEDLEKKTNELAQKLAKGPLKSYAKSKELIYETVFKQFKDFGEEEYKAQLELSKSEDFKEGVNSFVEKRAANFKGE